MTSGGIQQGDWMSAFAGMMDGFSQEGLARKTVECGL